MLSNVLVHSLVDHVNQDLNQRLFLTLVHNLVHILVHMLNHTLDEAPFDHSIALVFDIPFVTDGWQLIEMFASHTGQAVASDARTYFEGRIQLLESSGRIQVAELGGRIMWQI
jgi:hypothetical protein